MGIDDKATGASAVNVVHDQANWTIRVDKEITYAKNYNSDWGWMRSGETRDLSAARSPAQYYREGKCTVKSLRVPKKDEEALPDVPPERYLEKPLRPGTALESVVMSSTIRRAHIANADPTYFTSTNKIGSRLPLEQFGVSQHGRTQTRTKLPSH
eukprot:gene31740-6940_t